MNLYHFIARRLAFTSSKSFSKIIVRIAISSIAISLMTMIVASAILDGFKTEIKDKVYGFWGHIHITDTNINASLNQKPIDKNLPVLDTLARIAQIEYPARPTVLGIELSKELQPKASYGGVDHVQNFVLVPALLRTKKEFGAIILKGVDDSFDWNYMDELVEEGDTLSTSDTKPYIIVSEITANKLDLKVGQRIIVNTIKRKREWKKVFTVKGIYDTDLEEYDDRFAFVDMRRAQEILGWEEDMVSGVEVYVDDPRDIAAYNEYIYENIPSHLYSESIHVKYASIFEWLKLQDINMVTILVLMIIVSVINMITFLLIYILERSKMIGLLSAVGATAWQIRKIFIFSGAYIIFMGLVIGNVLALALCYIQKYFKIITLDERNYYLEYAPILISWEKVILLNILCFTVTVLFLLIPSFLVTRISPIKVLRFG